LDNETSDHLLSLIDVDLKIGGERKKSTKDFVLLAPAFAASFAQTRLISERIAH
jgi:hypothetical protein